MKGLGKTVTTLTAIKDLKYNRFEVRKVLVIAPKKVAEGTWTKEKDKWDHTKMLRVSQVLGARRSGYGPEYAGGPVYHQPGKCGVAGGLLPERLAI